MGKCSQCDKLAVVEDLCAEHYLMFAQAKYLELSLNAALINYIGEKIAAGTGYLIPPTRMEIPKPPFFVGNNLTLNNINVIDSTVGMINTGMLKNIKNIDNSITLVKGHGHEKIAAEVKELTEAVLKSTKATESTKQEILEQLETLVIQLTTEPHNRSKGIIKSLLSGIRPAIALSADLLTIWDKLEPLLRTALIGN